MKAFGDDFEKRLIEAMERREKEALGKSLPEAEILSVSGRVVALFPQGAELESLRKSYSKDLMKKYPGGRWVTIKEGPLAGRHIYILPHKDGSATVLAGGGPAMRHKVLSPKQDEDKQAEKKPDEKEPEKDAEEKTPKKLSTEQEAKAKQQKKEVSAKIREQREAMAQVVREKVGVETEITEKEKRSIEQRIAKIEDPDKRKKTEREEVRKLKAEKDDQMKKIIDEVKKTLIEDNPTAQTPPDATPEEREKISIAAAVKECAEELAQHHYQIEALKKQRKELNKFLRTGKSLDRFKVGSEVAVSMEPISMEQIKQAISDEKMRDAEMSAHYRLIEKTRGVEGVTQYKGKKKRLEGEKELERNIKQGGFEAITGLVGGVTGTSIMSKSVYDEIGPANAAILARHYLQQGGHDIKDAAKELEGFIEKEGNPVAMEANRRGDHFMQMAHKVRQFGQGTDNLLTRQQAGGTALKYLNKAYEAYGQAEGALNQGAEMLYAMKDAKAGMEITGNSKDAIDRKRRALGLKAKDVSVRRVRGEGYKMTIPPRSFDKLIAEQPTQQHGHGLGLEHSPAEIKALKANTDDFHPTAIREYTPEDKNGVSRKIIPKPEQQAAARFIAQQKRAYLNFEAGTGKSLAILLAKGHIEDTTGKPVKTIIAMPSKLMDNFADEVKKFTGYNVVKADSNSKKKRVEAYNADPNTIVLVNKEKFNFDKRHIKDAGFNMVVADEAHKITQREGRGKSDMSKGLSDVAKQAEYYVAMSGTPTPSDLSEMYFHANIINPERFGNQKEFMDRFGSAHRGVGYKRAISEFMNTQLDDHVYTAKKSVEGIELRMHRHNAKLSPEQKKAYREASQAYLRREINPLQRDQQYNNTLNSHDWRSNGKFADIDKIVGDHMKNKGPDEKVIFYAKNRATLDQIRSYLKEKYPQHGHVEFTGSTKKSDLARNKKAFKEDPNVRFSLHMRAGVEGLNLQYDGNGGGATTAIAVASGEDSYAPIDQFFSRGYRTGAVKDMDAHMILSDTPHDLGTEIRLEEKKQVGDLIQNKKMGRKGAGRSRQSAKPAEAVNKSLGVMLIRPRKRRRAATAKK